MYILDTKIVGGIEAWPHSHPYQVAIIIDTPKGQSFCGGAFVGKLLQKQSKVGILWFVFTKLDSRYKVSYLCFFFSENDYVFTAAHCLYEATSAQICLGAHNLKKPERNRICVKSQSFEIHYGFDPYTLVNDIAGIILPEDIDESKL